MFNNIWHASLFTYSILKLHFHVPQHNTLKPPGRGPRAVADDVHMQGEDRHLLGTGMAPVGRYLPPQKKQLTEIFPGSLNDQSIPSYEKIDSSL